MAFVELDPKRSDGHSSTKAGLSGGGLLPKLNSHVLTPSNKGNKHVAFGPSHKTSGRLQDYNVIEFRDMSGPPPEGSKLCEPALKPNGIEAGGSSVIYSNNSSTSDEQGGKQSPEQGGEHGSPSSPSTSVAGSFAK